MEEKKSFNAKYVPCKICGQKKYCREDVYQKRIEKFGSEEELLQNYICRNCKKKLKEEKTNEQQ